MSKQNGIGDVHNLLIREAMKYWTGSDAEKREWLRTHKKGWQEDLKYKYNQANNGEDNGNK